MLLFLWFSQVFFGLHIHLQGGNRMGLARLWKWGCIHVLVVSVTNGYVHVPLHASQCSETSASVRQVRAVAIAATGMARARQFSTMCIYRDDVNAQWLYIYILGAKHTSYSTELFSSTVLASPCTYKSRRQPCICRPMRMHFILMYLAPPIHQFNLGYPRFET